MLKNNKASREDNINAESIKISILEIMSKIHAYKVILKSGNVLQE